MSDPTVWLRAQIGVPYKWGANGPYAYDCSGLALAYLRAGGMLIADQTAADLALRGRKVSEPLPGRLVFYAGRDGKISHVCIVLDVWDNGDAVMIGANGGGADTTTTAEASAHGAYVGTCLYSRYRTHERAGIFAYD
jgi:hypothetical protein